jgi:hypothetical protein
MYKEVSRYPCTADFLRAFYSSKMGLTMNSFYMCDELLSKTFKVLLLFLKNLRSLLISYLQNAAEIEMRETDLF